MTVLNGDSGNNNLLGSENNDVLDGGIGADTLEGGAGDDVYVVDDAGDVVNETIWQQLEGGVVTRVSTAVDGTQSNYSSFSAFMFPDGSKVAFISYANNLVPDDTNMGGNSNDIFVKDLKTGAITRVSTTQNGTEANGSTNEFVFSSDGAKVVFGSDASNLVNGDNNGQYDIFIKDLQTGAITLVSTATNGTQSNNGFQNFSLSPDGAKITFVSFASNLVTNDTNGFGDVFVKDLITGETTRISTSSNGTQGNNYSRIPSFSPDGTKVVFQSDASNLVAEDTNAGSDIFIKDLITGELTRISTASDGTQGNQFSYGSVFSPDGKKVAFQSYATNLVAGDSVEGVIYIKDLETGEIVQADKLSMFNGLQFYARGWLPSKTELIFSQDASKVALYWYSDISNDGAFTDFRNIFVKDFNTGVISPVSANASGVLGNAESYNILLSPDGTKALFGSSATNLVVDDTNGVSDIFIKDLTSGDITRVSTVVSDVQANDSTYSGVFSSDGQMIAFSSAASNLVVGDTNGFADIFIKDLTNDVITRVSTVTNGVQANNASFAPAFSLDLTYIAFSSYASNLVSNDTNSQLDVFVKNLKTGEIIRVSTDSDGVEANGISLESVFSPDGTKVAFRSSASNLVAGDTNGTPDIFVKDLTTGIMTRVSTASDGSQANGYSDNAVFSPDGQKIAFLSSASNLISDDKNNQTDLFIKDLNTGVVSIVRDPVNTSWVEWKSRWWRALIEVDAPNDISHDGNKQTFSSGASNLVANDTNGVYDIFVRDYSPIAVDEGGVDTVQSSTNYVLPEYVENLTLTGTGNINGTGNDLGNTIIGNSVNNTLMGDAGDDILIGGTGNDLIIGGRGSDTVYFNLGDGNDTIDNQSDDTSTTTDVLVFGQGITLSDLTFIRYSNSPDSTMLINGTTDSIVAKNYFSQPQYYNNIELKFADGTVITYQQLLHIGFVRQGDDTNNTFYGFLGDDTLIGGLGDDTLAGGFATDSYKLGLGNDTVIYRYNQDGGDYVFEDLTNQEINDGADDGVDTYKIFNTPINSLGQAIRFGIEANTESYPNLVMTIGDNNPTLGTQTTNDWQDVVPLGWQGIYIENFFTRNPQGSDNGTPVLTAASAHDVFVFYSDEGMTEISRMTGQEIYNTYFSPVTPVNHAPSLTSASAILANGQENLLYTLSATQLLQGFSDADGDILNVTNVSTSNGIIADNGNGTFTIKPMPNYNGSISLSYQVSDGKGGLVDATQSFNLIKAASGDIIGTTGGDMLHGGSGDDTFIVNHVRDVVFEEANGGIDTVQSTLSHILRDNVENLILVGDTDLSGAGNNADNSLTGNNGNNRLLAGDGNDTLSGGAGGDTLNGGAGADVMFGGTGNDTFTVENAGDTVTEFEGEGFDTVNSFISYTLKANVERLSLEGMENLNGSGNDLDNTLNGNNANNLLVGGLGNDILQGKGGADTLEGGMSNDLYYVDNAGDIVTELASEGIDKVSSSKSYTLVAHVEQLFLTGIAGLTGTGNDLNNVIYGNSGDNHLDGGLGDDSLNGGLGDDSYQFGLLSDHDRINNTDASDGLDVVLFDAGITADQVWLRHVNNDLEVSIIGTTNSVKVQDWYSLPSKRVDALQLADGNTLLASEVETLVSAMAAFTPPAIGQTSLTTQQHAALDTVIATSW